MTADEITALFTNQNGEYHFARWNRPIAPIVFGVEDQSLEVIKAALEAVVVLANHKMTDADPELGSNFMIFFIRDWQELLETPDLAHLIPDLNNLVPKLKSMGANRYRTFRFDNEGGIKACFLFLCMDEELSNMPADVLALSEMVGSILLWGHHALSKTSPLAQTHESNKVILKPDFAAIIAAAYDPVMPICAYDASHALRLFARTPRS